MTPIFVKPAPDLDPAAAKLLKSDTGVGLLDLAGNVPEAGMPWPNGGMTLVLLRDGAIKRADDPIFAALAATKAVADAQAKADADAAATKTGEATVPPATEPPAATETPTAH